MAKDYVEIARFDGGANRRHNALQVPLNQALDLKGMGFDSYGSLRTFNGRSTLNSTQIITFPINGLFSYKPSTMSAQLMLVCGGDVLLLTGAATTPVTVPSGVGIYGAVNTVRRVDMVQFKDLLFLSDGTAIVYKFNGNEFTKAGVTAPAQALSVNCDAAGLPNGTYDYVYTGVNSYSAEGDYGGTSNAVAIVSGAIRVTNIPTAPVSHGIESWNVYRNTANAQGIYWLITAVSNGVTSFTDNVADSSLVTEAPTDQGQPRKFKYMLPHAGRLWGSVGSDSLLWFSEANEPETFPSTNIIRVGAGDGLEISGLSAHSGMVVITKSNWNGSTAIYTLVVGDSASVSDPENWYLKKVSDFGGSDSHWSITPYSNYLFMINSKGVYAFNGTQVSLAANGTDDGVLITHRLDELYGLPDGTTGLAFSMSPAELVSAAAINWKERIWVSIDEVGLNTSTEYGKNTTTHVFDYQRKGDSAQRDGAWSFYRAFGFTRFAIHENALYGASSGSNSDSPSGYIFKIDQSSEVLTSYTYLAPPMMGKKGHENREKDFRYLFITAVADSGTPSLTLFTSVNLGGRTTPSLQSHTITLSTTATRYRLDLTSAHHGKWFNMLIGGTPTIHFTINRIEVHYNLRGSRNA